MWTLSIFKTEKKIHYSRQYPSHLIVLYPCSLQSVFVQKVEVFYEAQISIHRNYLFIHLFFKYLLLQN